MSLSVTTSCVCCLFSFLAGFVACLAVVRPLNDMGGAGGAIGGGGGAIGGGAICTLEALSIYKKQFYHDTTL